MAQAAAGTLGQTTARSSQPPPPPPHARNRTPSPTRPPMSPITPPFPATDSSTHRNLTHANQPDHSSASGTTISPPQFSLAGPPIDLESNPDAIALRSAISILQIQRRRAEEDLRALVRVKAEAMKEPEAFAAALVEGKVAVRGTAVGSQTEDDDGDDLVEEVVGDGAGNMRKESRRAWESLPGPQNVVRCPQVNWAQYAVVGDSLDKIHADQVARPPEGTPAVINASGTYEFRGHHGGDDAEIRRKYIGVAAPYSPLHDKLDTRKVRGATKK